MGQIFMDTPILRRHMLIFSNEESVLIINDTRSLEGDAGEEGV